MSKRRNGWLKFGCFLTGYNYQILNGCSELSVKRVLRYTSAMLIICMLWAFIGYNFADRYLKASALGTVAASTIMIILVIQIERQVILSNKSNKGSLWFRMVIAVMMGLIGSIIIDQIIFKDDIEQQKSMMMGEKVNKILPDRTRELAKQIKEIDSLVTLKEHESKVLMDAIEKNPMVTTVTTHVERFKSREGKDSTRTVAVYSKVPNPKMDLLKQVEQKHTALRKEKNKKDSVMLTLRPIVEAELRQNVGFLDELELMKTMLANSVVALITWIVWFFVLLGLELFILVSKWSEPETDYDVVIQQQEQLHLKRLRLLVSQSP